MGVAVSHGGGGGDQQRGLLRLDGVAQLGRFRPDIGSGGAAGVEFIENPEADRRQNGDEDRNEQAGQEAHLKAPKPCFGYRGAYREMLQRTPPG